MSDRTNEDEIDADGMLEVLDPSGHFEVRWGKKKAEVESAEATFKDLLSKGYLAFKKTWTGRKGKQATEFDPKAGVYVFDKDHEAAAKNDEEVAKKAEEKAKAEADERAKKQERIDATKEASTKAAELASVAKREHEEATRKRREARTAKDAADREVRESTTRVEATTRRREEALKALEVAPKWEGPEVHDGAALGTPDDPLLAKREFDAAVVAESDAKKAHDEATARAAAAKSAQEEADTNESVAYQKKRDAEKAAATCEREYEDAMTALHGEPTNEQTKEFDKKAKTILTPPMRGG